MGVAGIAGPGISPVILGAVADAHSFVFGGRGFPTAKWQKI
jgi:hypothetical protein